MTCMVATLFLCVRQWLRSHPNPGGLNLEAYSTPMTFVVPQYSLEDVLAAANVPHFSAEAISANSIPAHTGGPIATSAGDASSVDTVDTSRDQPPRQQEDTGLPSMDQSTATDPSSISASLSLAYPTREEIETQDTRGSLAPFFSALPSGSVNVYTSLVESSTRSEMAPPQGLLSIPPSCAVRSSGDVTALSPSSFLEDISFTPNTPPRRRGDLLTRTPSHTGKTWSQDSYESLDASLGDANTSSLIQSEIALPSCSSWTSKTSALSPLSLRVSSEGSNPFVAPEILNGYPEDIFTDSFVSDVAVDSTNEGADQVADRSSQVVQISFQVVGGPQPLPQLTQWERRQRQVPSFIS